MKSNMRWILFVLVLISLALAACAPKASSAETIKPSKLEKIEGSEFQRVILTEKAAQRLDIQTTPVRAEGKVLVVPYAALLYGLHGETWVYTNPEPLVYIRENIVIDRIDEENVYLSQGPATGTNVVTVGAAMLYGTEVGVKK